MEERKGVPAISRLTWFWALVFTFFTSVVFALAMALHISFWVRSRRKRGFAFFGYLLIAASLVLGLLWSHHIARAEHWETIVSFEVVLIWVSMGFVLRRELMSYYASPEGGVLEMSRILTAVFSVYYLNYCLWVVRDSA
jgi:dipeptide/tripeptide permease